jgi:hypothetical protein
MNINQMKRAIHIRCMQQYLYFESHIKSLKQLHIIVCFSVLSISSAFIISTYFINTVTWKKFQEKNDIGYMYKQWLKNKAKHEQRAHYICVDLGINRSITFAQRKSITIVRKMYLSLLYICADYLLFRIYLIYS